jgi:pentalenene oxygenase
LVRNPTGFFAALPAYGDLVRIRLGRSSILAVCDNELTCELLQRDAVFDKGGPVCDRFKEISGDGLVTCPHIQHRRQRRLLQPAFHRVRMPGYARSMTREVENAIGSWRDGQTIDVVRETQTIAGRIIATTMFGARVDSGLPMMIRDMNNVVANVFRRMLTPPPLDRLPTPGKVRYDRSRARLHHAIADIIADARRTGPDTDHGDLLAALLAPSDERGDTLSDIEISDQVMIFFLAGTDTAAIALAWALHLLSRHPTIQQRLHREAEGILAGRAAGFDDIPGLELTGRVITESLRLYPPAWILTRVTSSETLLGGHRIHAGTNIIWSPYAIHRNPTLHPDPERFDPDRWVGAPSMHRNATMLPFGKGPRKCIGESFALTEATIALATIAARWRLHPVPGREVRPARSATMYPKHLRVRLQAHTTPP